MSAALTHAPHVTGLAPGSRRPLGLGRPFGLGRARGVLGGAVYCGLCHAINANKELAARRMTPRDNT